MCTVPTGDDILRISDDSQVQDFLRTLEKHRLDCEQSGKYDEAELAKSRLDQLRQHEEEKRREELRSAQLSERLNVEEAHMRELQDFNDSWDAKAAEFEQHAANLQGQLDNRHQEDHSAYLKKLLATTEPRNPRWSKELLNLRKIEDTVARQKQYSEAGRVQQQADQVEADERAAWQAKREQKMTMLEEQSVEKQRKEMGGLLKRIQSGRDEQKQARKAELERLLQRYHNVKAQLESQQRIIQHKVERYPVSTPRGSIHGSRPVSAMASRASLNR